MESKTPGRVPSRQPVLLSTAGASVLSQTKFRMILLLGGSPSRAHNNTDAGAARYRTLCLMTLRSGKGSRRSVNDWPGIHFVGDRVFPEFS